MRIMCVLLGLGLLGQACNGDVDTETEPEDWLDLFNGRDILDWTPKVAGHDVGVNHANTFRVEDGLLKVRYDGYGAFDDQFGHLFYNEPFSYYRLLIEYRFVGDQAAGGADWAWRNSGAMLHSQPPWTMEREQDFPISIEVQLLGGRGDGSQRTTANVCTPGTEIVLSGEIAPRHCIESTSATFDGDQWVRVEVLVLGDSSITHLVEGDTVLHYIQPQIGGGVVANYDPSVKVDGTPLSEGFISLQSESHPIDFRVVRLLNLTGCTDESARNYRSYFVQSNPGACAYGDGPP